ncbi:hypothetical protein GCM10010260_71050 [Streptomyces filipinensis]|uniref:Uncharacterized protein n=1 Tax=Streptomyces filipinensis TaxID=66887 RepID=A0A918ME44_9ACTN|nr:hypothetical protein [Streptomyces filipinensis]GGV20764.1 hypothetical protein GCM10010260_71050 [Streptomyces filipinensis]
MHRNEDADRTTRGLSTEDLARPTGADTDAAPDAASSEAPVYPGESTGTASGEGASGAGGAEAQAAAPESSGTATAADATGAPGASDDEAPQLMTDDEERAFRDRWQTIQNRFVDDPREAVHDADTLVADVMQSLAATFSEHKKGLEAQWSQGEKVDTEALRGALRRYRSFFNRLLST